ncbi:MAG: hypothetical protein KF894_30860 [Labilithrix sp.]|nr:hypothetical protein [Labilithrix sp.]
MIAALVRVPLARLVRAPRGWLPIAGWTLLAIVAALSARTSSGADHVLRGTFGFVVLPLLTYGIVSATLGGAGLRPALRGLVAIGASPPRAALGSIGVAMTVSAVTCGLLAAAVCLVAHTSSDPPLAWDLPASFGVASLGGATYAAYFCAGSAVGRGAMRGALLALDYVVGAGAGFGSLFTPRGHVMSLLGGPAAFELPRRMSSVLLVLLAVIYVGLAVRLARRVR